MILPEYFKEAKELPFSKATSAPNSSKNPKAMRQEQCVGGSVIGLSVILLRL